jgi:hypothetical protein
MKSRADVIQAAVGLLAVALASVLLASGLGLRALAVDRGVNAKAYSITTGFLLLVVFLMQWRLFLFRRSKVPHRASNELVRHQWVGVLLIALLVVHAGSIGVGLSSFLGAAIVIVSIAGFLFKPLFRKSPLVWRWIHIGLSAILLSLVFLHAWAGLVFHGPGVVLLSPQTYTA